VGNYNANLVARRIGMLYFHDIVVPVASSMIELAEHAHHPFQKYFCYWAAFNNIYTLIGQQQGALPRFVVDRAGNVKIEQEWGFKFPKVITPSERQRIKATICIICANVKNALITHPNVKFFVERTPKGVLSSHDLQSQLINGVLNITRTINLQSPIWSPIDKKAYQIYIAGDPTSQDILTEQIILMLYTVRNNLVHGGKSPNEANDIRVVENALPLLELVVRTFFRELPGSM
jgi:hypothetical protein